MTHCFSTRPAFESELVVWLDEIQRAALGRREQKKRDMTWIRMAFNKKKGCIFEERRRDTEATDCMKSHTYKEVVAARFEEAIFRECKNVAKIYLEQR